MQKILLVLQRVYGNPVDIEYAVNMDSGGDFVMNLLQCRLLYLGQEGKHVNLSRLNMQDVFWGIQNSSMGVSRKRQIDVVVQINPVLYYEYPYMKKYDVAAAIR